MNTGIESGGSSIVNNRDSVKAVDRAIKEKDIENVNIIIEENDTLTNTITDPDQNLKNKKESADRMVMFRSEPFAPPIKLNHP